MANSGSILGFVNQLQNMELQMASILMETAMKLANMTDANVFMLVEHSGGRYFSGKRYLCDTYLSHRLNPIGNDVELEINPDVSALQERPRTYYPPPPPPRSSPSSNSRHAHSTTKKQHQQSDDSAPPAKSFSRKRSSTNHQLSVSLAPSSSSSPSKKKRTSDGVGSSSSLAPATLNDLKIEASSEGFQFQEDEVLGGVIESDAVSYESAMTKVDRTDDDDDANKDDDNDDLEIICEDENGVTFPIPDRPPPSVLSDDVLDSDGAAMSDWDKSWIFAEIMEHPKLEAVKQICDESVSDKNSVSSKLLNSLLYDFSKIAAAKCPFRSIEDPKCKQFYSLCFEEIWNQLPNLQALHERGGTSQIGKRMYPIKVACRERFRNNFRTNLGKNRMPNAS